MMHYYQRLAQQDLWRRMLLLHAVELGQPSVVISKSFNGDVATVGNGVMVALAVATPAQVDALYAKAIEFGATDEGPAGPREEGFYAGYFRDLEGNKLNFFCMS